MLALDEVDHHALVVARRTQAVDARHAGDDDDILAADQRAGGGQAQAVDVLVDEGVFFDVDVALRDVRFGLIVVVIADEIVDGVVREEALELLVELGRQRLVVRQDERRLAELSDDVARGEGLAGAGGAEQRLAGLAGPETVDEFVDGLRLIAGGLKLADQLKRCDHASILLRGFHLTNSHERTQPVQRLDAYTGDMAQVVHFLERRFLSRLDDASRQCRADAGQMLQLLDTVRVTSIKPFFSPAFLFVGGLSCFDFGVGFCVMATIRCGTSAGSASSSTSNAST